MCAAASRCTRRLPSCAVHCSVSYSLLPAAAAVAQIYDVEIDAVNKPFLPVAAGELSKGAAWALCLLLAAGEAGGRCMSSILHCHGLVVLITEQRAGAGVVALQQAAGALARR